MVAVLIGALSVGLPATGFLGPTVGWVLSIVGAWGLVALGVWFFWPSFQRLLAGSVVFANREELDKAFPIRRQVEQATTIDGLWVTGRTILGLDDELLIGTIRHVILPSLDRELVVRLAQLSRTSDDTVGSDIRYATRRASALAKEVRWLKDFPGFTLLLVDADSKGAYAHLGVLLPDALPEDRIVFRVVRRRDREAFERLKQLFEDVWRNRTTETVKDLYD